jgi:hypothetical protein
VGSFGSIRLLLFATMIALAVIGVAANYLMRRCGFKGVERALLWVPVIALECVLGFLYPLLVP